MFIFACGLFAGALTAALVILFFEEIRSEGAFSKLEGRLQHIELTLSAIYALLSGAWQLHRGQDEGCLNGQSSQDTGDLRISMEENGDMKISSEGALFIQNRSISADR
ncbi:MAG: hypothetical protein ACOYJV_01560 [Aminivibrio sp.]